MQLSPNFSLSELVYSETAEKNGIDNTPPPEIVENLKRLAAGLETVRALLGAPLEISSGYRCVALNEAVGGSGASQHLLGLAVDFACPGRKLAIELDGGQHAQQAEEDTARTRELARRGYRVIRFWNNDVMHNLAGVLEIIRRELD